MSTEGQPTRSTAFYIVFEGICSISLCLSVTGSIKWGLGILCVLCVAALLIGPYLRREDAMSASYLCTRCFKKFSFQELLTQQKKPHQSEAY